MKKTAAILFSLLAFALSACDDDDNDNGNDNDQDATLSKADGSADGAAGADGSATDADIDGSVTDADIDGSTTDASIDGSTTDADIDGSVTDADIDGSVTDADIDGSTTDADIDDLPCSSACAKAYDCARTCGYDTNENFPDICEAHCTPQNAVQISELIANKQCGEFFDLLGMPGRDCPNCTEICNHAESCDLSCHPASSAKEACQQTCQISDAPDLVSLECEELLPALGITEFQCPRSGVGEACLAACSQMGVCDHACSEIPRGTFFIECANRCNQLTIDRIEQDIETLKCDDLATLFGYRHANCGATLCDSACANVETYADYCGIESLIPDCNLQCTANNAARIADLISAGSASSLLSILDPDNPNPTCDDCSSFCNSDMLLYCEMSCDHAVTSYCSNNCNADNIQALSEKALAGDCEGIIHLLNPSSVVPSASATKALPPLCELGKVPGCFDVCTQMGDICHHGCIESSSTIAEKCMGYCNNEQIVHLWDEAGHPQCDVFFGEIGFTCTPAECETACYSLSACANACGITRPLNDTCIEKCNSGNIDAITAHIDHNQCSDLMTDLGITGVTCDSVLTDCNRACTGLETCASACNFDARSLQTECLGICNSQNAWEIAKEIQENRCSDLMYTLLNIPPVQSTCSTDACQNFCNSDDIAYCAAPDQCNSSNLASICKSACNVATESDRATMESLASQHKCAELADLLMISCEP